MYALLRYLWDKEGQVMHLWKDNVIEIYVAFTDSEGSRHSDTYRYVPGHIPGAGLDHTYAEILFRTQQTYEGIKG